METACRTLQHYYRWHARIYDSTRWSFLFGRARLVRLLAQLLPASAPEIVEVGCGTGHNLKALAKTFSAARLTGIDLCRSMLCRAARATAGNESRIRLVCAPYGADSLPAASVDAVVFSYALTMLSAFGVNLLSHLGLGLITAYLAAFTIVVASIIALTKDDLKARLAYSTVSQLSYIIIGVGMLTPMAVTGGLLHIAHHAFAKITLFFAAGSIFVATGLRSIKLMDGLGRKLPWTFGAFAVASLSMIGMPPVCGFVSKWYLANGAIAIHNNILLLALLASTLLNAGYFVPVIYRAFFRPPVAELDHSRFQEAPMFPFHTWLPAAHVEAPAAGSVLLAAILLKMGTYGFLRFCLPLTPAASVTAAPFMARPGCDSASTITFTP